jgi:hypothetical protein
VKEEAKKEEEKQRSKRERGEAREVRASRARGWEGSDGFANASNDSPWILNRGGHSHPKSTSRPRWGIYIMGVSLGTPLVERMPLTNNQ